MHFAFQSAFMNKQSSIGISAKIWITTVVLTAVQILVGISIEEGTPPGFAFFVVPIATTILSIPALITLAIVMPIIQNRVENPASKIKWLLVLLLLILLLYSLAAIALLFGIHSFNFSETNIEDLQYLLVALGLLAVAIIFSVAINYKAVINYFYNSNSSFSFSFFFNSKKYKAMEEIQKSGPALPASNNKILIKGFITGFLILLMLIPTIFISNLISEREARQKEIVKEVSSKWAATQTLSCPFLVVPYSYTYQGQDGKPAINQSHLIFLADTVMVAGNILPEERQRSIYKVLLYRSSIEYKGNFKVALPTDIDATKIDFGNAKICFTLSDYKGIEEDVLVQFNNEKLILRPGLPLNDFGKTGLSAPVKLEAATLLAGLPFSMQIKIKGSEQLHFIPMASSSKFELSSKWNDPSFDGEMLPNERKVTQEGFHSKWSFNQANLPFSTVIQPNSLGENKMNFGVSLVQPADQYGKTMRSVKYAILFIGLTFAFFFIIELMQQKPFHPVQYVLVGIALVIFYTLLLSFSEFIKFDTAYIIAALATILLISGYAKSHFKSWKTAGIFFGLLSLLYAFIFVLIQLEDTALLVGSIGLFVVLALAMYASRKINWYGTASSETVRVAS